VALKSGHCVLANDAYVSGHKSWHPSLVLKTNPGHSNHRRCSRQVGVIKQGCHLNAPRCQDKEDCDAHCPPEFFLAVSSEKNFDVALVNLLEA